MPTTTTTTKCRSCGAAIIWAKTAGGSSVPLDAEPVPNGNIVLRSDGIAVYLKAADARPTGGCFVSHFATCPNAAQHRKRGQ